MFENRYSRIVIPTEVEGSFLQEGIMSYVRQRKGENFSERSKKSGVRERFLATLEMTVWGNGFISRSV